MASSRDTDRVARIDPAQVSAQALTAAAAWIRAGGIVVFPTETFYGLAVDPTRPAAVAALFDLKGRDRQVAVPLVAASREALERLCGPIDARSAVLADRFWPGSLSLVIEAPATIAPEVHGGAGTIAVRVPSHPLARALAEAAGGLVTSTSANRSGEPAAVDVASLGSWRDDPRVYVIDGGPTAGGAPSTIVDARRSPPILIREGAVPWSRVLESQ